ncbi:MAG: hypothetical protein AB7T37_10460 [Dehalococcoidia bacterium]
MTRRLLMLVVLTLAGCLANACDGDGAKPAAVSSTLSLLAWEGDFASPARPVLVDSRGERSPVGPPFLSLDVLRADPSGARGAALAVDRFHEPLQLYVFDLHGNALPRQRDIPMAGRPQDLAWSPDGRLLAAVLETGAVIFEIEDLEPVASIDGVGRISGPLTGEIWSPDSSRVAFGASGGVAVLRATGSIDLIPFALSRLNPSSAIFAGWSPEGRLLALDASTEFYYDHSGASASTWEPSLPAEPLFDYIASVRAAADAAYAVLSGGNVSLSRSAAGGRAVLGVAWKSAGIEDGLQRGPFDVAVAVVVHGSDAVTFTFPSSPAFAGLREGRLVDVALPAERP